MVIVPRDSVVYIATDEADEHFFDVFRENYKKVYFLDDFEDLLVLDDIPKEFYGMIDQLVASRGKHFVGTYYSTFTSYINRLRGYHSQKQQTTSSSSSSNIRRQGIIPSWFYSPPDKINQYQRYTPLGTAIFETEYPLAWRNIDLDVDAGLRKAVERDEAA